MPARSTATGEGRPPTRQTDLALLLIIGGALLIFFAAEITTLQIQTNEAFLRGEPQTNEAINSDWSVWFQLPKLAWASAPGPALQSNDVPSVILSQGVELVYIIIVSATGVVASRNKKMAPLFSLLALIGLVIICIFDSYSDYKFGNIPEWEHVAFALFCAFAIGFFPKWGLGLIKEGYKHL